ncbi:MAG: ribosome small subunit-dependent GTPase A [Treponema sp.]|jgi:ribosome biogenesis GTPase|nr:ribosome small subunit-dependent GTPase A [Treponema sp.]
MFDLKAYGYMSAEIPGEGLIPGRVMELRRELYTCVCEYGEIPAVVKGSFAHRIAERAEFPTVGDFVFLSYNESGSSAIARVLPRRSKFSRSDFSGHAAGYVKNIQEQVAAANFDFVFILSSLNQDFKANRISRYLTAAWNSGGLPVLILTKADLCTDFSVQVKTARKLPGEVPVIPLSSLTGFGLENLGEYLQPGKTVVFLGSSGVGKSSLLNTLAGRELMTVKAIRHDDGRGRHTTTHRQMFRLPSGALVIDTPGMRELGLWDAGEGIGEIFSAVESLFTRCRFSNCTHTVEPDCAVRAALESGDLPRDQWEQYLLQKKEAAFVENRSAYLREKQEWHKSLAKSSQLKKRNGFFE